MPKVSTVPEKLRPYIFHGLDLQDKGHNESLCECPWCGKQKFYINQDSGEYDCKVCGDSGNTYGFLRKLWQAGKELQDEGSDGVDLVTLAAERQLLSATTLVKWGVVKSVITGEWLVPGYQPDGNLNQIYKYTLDHKTGKYRLYPTSGLGHCLFGINLYDKKKPNVYICEGPWDAMALYEYLASCKRTGKGIELATGPGQTMLGACNIVAVPGCNVFADHWAKMFGGKFVFLLYDNDHPHEVKSKIVPPAGYTGMKRVAGIIGATDVKPKAIHYLKWGEQGYDPKLKSGYDVRDYLTVNRIAGSKKIDSTVLNRLHAKLVEVPEEWVEEGKKLRAAKQDVELLPCEKWSTLVTSWRKALKWTAGLDRGLSVMLASIISTRSVGDQLWVKILGPASSGKSTLCEAISTNKAYVFAKSSIRGFHSGFKSDKDGSEDNSLLVNLKNKTLVTKDGDTLLQAPNLSQILSEARDIYDRVSRTHYRNRMSKDYEGINMTWILCGTSSLRQIDSSELGERFVDCVIVDNIDEEQEAEIAMRVAYRAERELSFIADGKLESRDTPEMVEAKRLTGGYISHLCENAQTLLERTRADHNALAQCVKLGTFVAYMRARPSVRQEEKAEREMAYRLVSQMVRLAKCIAVVLNRPTVDEEALARVKAVALDTARGVTLEVARYLYNAGEAGLDTKQLALYLGRDEDKMKVLLRYLRRIKMIEIFQHKVAVGLVAKPRWRLTERVEKLYGEVIDDAQSE